jgi:hypothetical protein
MIQEQTIVPPLPADFAFRQPRYSEGFASIVDAIGWDHKDDSIFCGSSSLTHEIAALYLSFPQSNSGGDSMKNDELFIERRAQGDYAVRRPNAQRASAVTSTQREAIDRAKRISPNSTPMVERVRYTNRGKPDQWRKP